MDTTDYNATGHRGNILLKPQGVQQNWTQHQIDEWIKCRDDPIYFIENYTKIISEEGLVSFQLRDYQKEMVSTVFENKFILIGTARQAGKSTTVSGIIVHFILFNEHKNVAILANKEATAIEILGKVQLAYQHLPKWIQQGIIEWNKKSATLENGSRVFAAATSSDSIRGYSIDFLFIDEAAHIDAWDAFFTSTFPVISARKQAKVVLVSTPNGMNHFHKLWAESMQGKNQYKRVEVTWDKIPGRDEAWRLMTLGAMGNNADKFAQEYEMQFLGSSGTLIAGWKLKEIVWMTPIYEKEGLTKYYDPVPEHQYAICCDVSEGKGFDYSTFSVIDVTRMPYEQVCAFRSNTLTAPDFAQEIYQCARLYNMASVLIETNIALGPEVAMILYSDLEYENVLFTASNGAQGRKLTTGFGDATT
jgi:terminase large subunit-like protein